MKQLAIYTVIILFILSCSERAGSISDVDVEVALSGTVTDTNQTGVSDVQIYLYSSRDGVMHEDDTILIDSVLSDSIGKYHFDSLSSGIYHIHANYEDSLFATERNILFEKENLVIDTMELRGPGTIKGTVNFDADNKRGVLLYIPGTSYSAYSDSLGGFTIENIPAGTAYSIVASLYGYSAVEVRNITIKSMETVTLQPIYLTANLYPSGLESNFDSTSRAVSLTWNKLERDDITGYLIFRKDSLLTALYPEQLNDVLISDTFYIDTLPETLFNTTDTVTMEYRIKAQTTHDFTSFSTPSFVETFIKRNPDDKKSLSIHSLKKGSFEGNEKYTLTWNYTGLIDSVRIELTINNGASWSEITPPIKNKGSYSIKLPNTSAVGTCRFKITSLKDSSLYDLSEYFSIKEVETILIKNGDFSAGLQHWFDIQFADNPAEYTMELEEGKVKFHITKAGDYRYQIRFSQTSIPLIEGKQYRLSLDAKASKEFQIWGGLQQSEVPWKQYEVFYFDLDTTEQNYSTYLNITSTDLTSAFTIDLGGDTGTVWLDNIDLELVE